MGELFPLRKMSDVRNERFARNERLANAVAISMRLHPEVARNQPNAKIRQLQKVSVEMAAKRKKIKAVITKDSIDHIRYEIKKGHISLTEDDLRHLGEFMESATYHSSASADREGKHKKKGAVQGFKYFSFVVRGETLYLNVAHKRINNNGKWIYVDELYTITKEVKK